MQLKVRGARVPLEGAERLTAYRYGFHLYPHGVYAVLLIVVCIVSSFDLTGFDPKKYIWLIITSCIALCVHLIHVKDQNWLRFDTVFLIGFFVVNFQWPLMYLFSDKLPLYRYQMESLQQYGNFAVTLASIALLSWLSGYSAVTNMRVTKSVERIYRVNILNVAFLFSIVLFAGFAGKDFFQRTIYTTSGSLTGQTVSSIAAYLLVIVDILAILLLSFLVYRKIHFQKIARPQYVTSVLLLVLYCLTFTIGGERGQVSIIFVSVGLAVAACIRPVKFWEFVLLGVVGFLLFSLLGIARAVGSGGTLEIDTALGWWGISNNLSQSMVTVTQAVAVIEFDRVYQYGLLWLSQVVGIVPFGQSALLGVSDLTPTEINSANYLTAFTLGSTPYSGLGTSYVADIFLNFGVFGLVVISSIYGAICSRIAHWLKAEDGFKKYFISMTFCGLCLYMARSSILFQLRPVLWGLLVLVLLVRIRKLK